MSIKSPREEPGGVMHAIGLGGEIKLLTALELIELIKKKTTYGVHIEIVVRTPTLFKTIDNEVDAQQTIDNMKEMPNVDPEQQKNNGVMGSIDERDELKQQVDEAKALLLQAGISDGTLQERVQRLIDGGFKAVLEGEKPDLVTLGYQDGDPPDQPMWGWYSHGDGWALMEGEHSKLHGLNRITVEKGGFDWDGERIRTLISDLLNKHHEQMKKENQ